MPLVEGNEKLGKKVWHGSTLPTIEYPYHSEEFYFRGIYPTKEEAEKEAKRLRGE